MLSRFFVCFLILFGFRFFGGTPFDAIINVFMMVVSLVWGIYLLFNLRSGVKIGNVNYLPYLILVGLSFIFSVTQASAVWGQGIIDGIVANNRHIFVFGLFFIAYYLPKTNYSIKRIEVIISWMMWINLFIYTILNLGFSGFEYESISGGQYNFDPTRFQRSLMIMGSFYYFHKYLKQANSEYLIVSLVFFLAPNVFEVQRTQVLFISFVLFYLTFTYSRHKSIIYQLSSYFSIGIGVLMLVVIYIDPIKDYFSSVFEFFTYAFQAVFQGEITPDSSSTGRITQFLFIAEKLFENFALGNGLLRGSIQSEITGLNYFHPTDLGLVGAIYAFGLITIPIYILSTLLHFKAYKLLKGNSNLLLRGLISYEFYLIIESITTAKLIFNNHHFIAVNIIILALIQMEKNDKRGASSHE